MKHIEKKTIQTMELGSSGLKRSGGLVLEEFLNELKGQKGIKVFTEMSRNDPIVGSILFTIRSLVRQLKWEAYPADDSPKSKKSAKLMNEVMNDMKYSWGDTISEVLSMLEYGWSWHEVVYKKRKDGKIGWSKLAPRAQTTLLEWVFDDNGDVVSMIQMDPYTWTNVEIPLAKSMLFRTINSKQNPEGQSILRNAYTSWYKKKHIESIEAIGVERDLTGYPVAWVPPELMDPNATTEIKNSYEQIKNIVTNVRRDEQEGIVFPLDYDDNGNKRFDFTLMTSGGSRAFDTNAIIHRYNASIASSVLFDFVLLGTMGEGSFALITEKIKLAQVALSSILDNICDTLNRHGVPKLMELNGVSEENYPVIRYSPIADADLNALSRYIERLSRAGIPFIDDAEELKSLAGIGQGKKGKAPSGGASSGFDNRPQATAGGSRDKLA